MQFTTADLKKKTANYSPGICKIILIGIEILPEIKTNPDGVFDWPYGLPLTAFPLFTIVNLDLVKDTFRIIESPKESKAGPFYELKISAESNNPDEESLRTVTTLSYKPVQAIVSLNNGKAKIYGQSDRGLDLSVSTEMSNDGTRIEKLSISLTGQAERLAPYTNVTL